MMSWIIDNTRRRKTSGGLPAEVKIRRGEGRVRQEV